MDWQIAPPEVKTHAPRAVITGREQVLIQQHTGLFSYETKCIRIRTEKGLWTVTGKGLVIAYFGLQDVLIKGEIDGMILGDKGT